MSFLNPVVKCYPWGSRTSLPELAGESSPAVDPIAEYWFGSHELGSSVTSSGESLADLITSDPSGQLGEGVLSDFGQRLPFLVKLLSAERALSLQVHPGKEQAEIGFAEEERKGVPLDSFERIYRDSYHKPELLVALSEFHALVGFRPVFRTMELLDALEVPSLEGYRDALVANPTSQTIKLMVDDLITKSCSELAETVEDLKLACCRYLGKNVASSRWASVAATVMELASQFPNDAGVVISILLNRVVLAPGDSVFIGPGQLHAYLRGNGVEVMANSDNVLRGGLTEKHVDLQELTRVFSCEPLSQPIARPVQLTSDVQNISEYVTTADEFCVSRYELETGLNATVAASDSPEIWLCTGGEVEFDDGDASCSVVPARAAWVPSTASLIRLTTAKRSTLFRIQVGRTAVSAGG